MPFLAGLLGSAFSGLFSWFAQFLTRKVALIATAITAVVGLTAGLLLAFTGLINGIVAVLPAGAQLGFALLPPNTIPCLTAYVSALTLKWAYDWNTRIIQWSLGGV